MNQKYLVILTEAALYQLKQLLASGNSSARKLRRA